MNFNINKAAILGAGVMGAGIAAHLAGAGIPVLLLDMVPRELTEKEKAKGITLESKVVRNRFAQTGKDGVTNPKARMIYDKSMGDLITVGNFTDDMDKIAECDWVVEVILEDLQVKKNFLKDLAQYHRPGMIITSNTSGVSINKIVEDMPLEFRSHFLGTHFFNPPRYMKLFELIPCEDTKPEILEFMNQFGTHTLGKGVVLAKDTPNFIGNRIGTYSVLNTLKVMEEYDLSVGEVDALTGPAIGRPKSATFRTIDMVGVDILKKVAGNVADSVSGAKEIEDHQIPEWMDKLIQMGHLGNKTKQGVYKKVKQGGKKGFYVWDKETEDYVPYERVKSELASRAMKSDNKFKTLVEDDSKEGRFVWEILKNVLIYSASKVPEITEDFTRIDKAMRWGYNWELGPFEIWDKLGVAESVERMEKDGEVVPEWVKARLAQGEAVFYDYSKIELPYLSLSAPSVKVIKETSDAALLDIGDGIACLQFRTKGNSVTDGVMDMIEESVKIVEADYKGLVLGNEGGNFSLGANLMLIATMIQSQDWDALRGTVKKFQEANMALKYSRKPVVAAPYGMTLGGGAEIVMHAHSVVASAELYMGLVEMGVGLVPGGGGTKELLLRNIESLGKVDNAEIVTHVKRAWEDIAMAKVSGSAHEAMNKKYLRKSDKIVMNSDYLLEHAKKQALVMSETFVPLKKENIKVVGHTGRATLVYMIEFMKQGGFISEYDGHIASKIASILTGGNTPVGAILTENQLLELERDAFVSLCQEEKTQARIEHMLKKGKPLRN